LDFLGRFVTPTGNDGKPVNLFGNDNILAVASEGVKGLLGSSSTHGSVGVLRSKGVSAYIDHLNAIPGIITVSNKHSRATTMIHETIHSLEDRNRNLRDRVSRFFERRSDGHYTIEGGKFGPGESLVEDMFLTHLSLHIQEENTRFHSMAVAERAGGQRY
jgi:hypothetical protein